MTPLVRRSWAPIGQTPVLRHVARHHDKLSCIGALTISPERRRVNVYMHLYAARSVTEGEVVVFLRDLLRHLPGHVVVVWDRINQHRSRLVERYAAQRRRVSIEYLPAYAPELNPVEQMWGHLKHHRLANHAIFALEELQSQVVQEARRLRKRRRLLRSFVHATRLPISL